MKYTENDFYSGMLESCYMNPRYHAGCLMCTDRSECYGKEEYLRFREKALIMSELLERDDLLDPRQAKLIANTMNMEKEEIRIARLLSRKLCPDYQISKLIKMSLGLDDKSGALEKMSAAS